MKDQPALYCGNSNIELPVRNKSFFPKEYQDKSRLHYYASIYNSLEVNSSFYKIPMPRTVAKWAEDVPQNFCFTFKLFKGITHAKELVYDAADIQRFFNAIDNAGDRKGCVLVQFPASIKRSLYQRVRTLLDDIANANSAGWRLALEFRDSSWYDDKVYQLLEAHKAIIVKHDMPKSATPLIDMETEFEYLRFHGEKGDYRGSYDEEVLQDHVYNISGWLDDDKPVFAYFNNTMGSAVQNALLLPKLLGNIR